MTHETTEWKALREHITSRIDELKNTGPTSLMEGVMVADTLKELESIVTYMDAL